MEAFGAYDLYTSSNLAYWDPFFATSHRRPRCHVEPVAFVVAFGSAVVALHLSLTLVADRRKIDHTHKCVPVYRNERKHDSYFVDG